MENLALRLAPWSNKNLATSTLRPRAKNAETLEAYLKVFHQNEKLSRPDATKTPKTRKHSEVHPPYEEQSPWGCSQRQAWFLAEEIILNAVCMLYFHNLKTFMFALIGILCLPVRNPKSAAFIILEFSFHFQTLMQKSTTSSRAVEAPQCKRLSPWWPLGATGFVANKYLSISCFETNFEATIHFTVLSSISLVFSALTNSKETFLYLAIKSAPRLRSSSNMWTWPAWKYSYICRSLWKRRSLMLFYFPFWAGGVCFRTLAARWIGCSPCESHPVTEVPCSRSKLRISCW